MTTPAHKTEGVNRTKNMRFCSASFTGKERDEETGYGYFGARYMDHELMTMWLSVDPMADKYPSLSPYSYCAWNPVRLVDPDGREIYFVEGERSFFYRKNQEGVYGFYDKETGEQYSGNNQQYVNNLLSSLESLKEGKYGRQLVEFFEGKDNDVKIQAGVKNNFDTETETIEWNDIIESLLPTESNPIIKGFLTSTPTFISLGHELKHAKDFRTNPIKYNKSGLSFKETSAMVTENLIRLEHFLPQRTYYDLNATLPAITFPETIPGQSVLFFQKMYDSLANHFCIQP